MSPFIPLRFIQGKAPAPLRALPQSPYSASQIAAASPEDGLYRALWGRHSTGQVYSVGRNAKAPAGVAWRGLLVLLQRLGLLEL